MEGQLLPCHRPAHHQLLPRRRARMRPDFDDDGGCTPSGRIRISRPDLVAVQVNRRASTEVYTRGVDEMHIIDRILRWRSRGGPDPEAAKPGTIGSTVTSDEGYRPDPGPQETRRVVWARCRAPAMEEGDAFAIRLYCRSHKEQCVLSPGHMHER